MEKNNTKKENRNELKQNQDELHLHKNVQKDSAKISLIIIYYISKIQIFIQLTDCCVYKLTRTTILLLAEIVTFLIL